SACSPSRHRPPLLHRLADHRDAGRPGRRRASLPVTLELGGKSPQLVFADAELESALPSLVGAIIQNAGQTCSAGSRVLVERSVHDALLERLAEAFAGLRAGPASRDLDLGPMVSRRQQERVWDALSEAQSAGIRFVAQ